MIMSARLLSSIPRLLSVRFGQDMDKPLATDVLKTKVKISLFTVLFTDYCSPITIHNHCSLLLFMVLFTQNFCLFKGGCPLSLNRFFLELPLRTIESLSLRKFLISPKNFLLLYNLVSRTRTSFVTVNLYC